jgi:hypothetical protein
LIGYPVVATKAVKIFKPDEQFVFTNRCKPYVIKLHDEISRYTGLEPKGNCKDHNQIMNKYSHRQYFNFLNIVSRPVDTRYHPEDQQALAITREEMIDSDV